MLSLWLWMACKGGSETEVVWTRDVKPIVETHCVSCHTEGNIAPFALDTYAAAAPLAAAMAGAVEDRRMPPWPPAPDCNDYENDPSLTEEEIATLSAWADAGAPEGDAADAVDGTPLVGDPWTGDLELPMPDAFTPTTGPDQYRCFLLDWPYDEERFITGLRVDPGNLAIVHHVIAFAVPADQVQAARDLDEADTGEGYDCFGGAGVSEAYWIGGWVPGSSGDLAPEGVGIPMEAGGAVVMQLHYNLDSGDTNPDLSTLILAVEESVDYSARIAKIFDPRWVVGEGMLIPAGEAASTHTFDYPNPLRQSVRLWAAGLHMHQLGASARLALVNEQGDEEACLLDLPRWDFHWQGSYSFVEPLTLDATDELRITCTFDNASGTGDVTWGEGTADEMCLGTVYASL